MSQRRFIADQYQLTETGERGKMIDCKIEFAATPTYQKILKAVEKRLEKRPEMNGYEVIVYWAVRYSSGDRKQAFSYKIQY